jgi:hypothetical protein
MRGRRSGRTPGGESVLIRFGRCFCRLGRPHLTPGIVSLFRRWNSIQRCFVGLFVDSWTAFGGRRAWCSLLEALRVGRKGRQRDDRRKDDWKSDCFRFAGHVTLPLARDASIEPQSLRTRHPFFLRTSRTNEACRSPTALGPKNVSIAVVWLTHTNKITYCRCAAMRDIVLGKLLPK